MVLAGTHTLSLFKGSGSRAVLVPLVVCVSCSLHDRYKVVLAGTLVFKGSGSKAVVVPLVVLVCSVQDSPRWCLQLAGTVITIQG